MLAARVVAIGFQAMAPVVLPAKVRVKVPPMMVPAKVIVWMTSRWGMPPASW
jgi:hypothetical protein